MTCRPSTRDEAPAHAGVPAQLQPSLALWGAVATSGEPCQGCVVLCLPQEGQHDAKLHLAELPGHRRWGYGLNPARQQD